MRRRVGGVSSAWLPRVCADDVPRRLPYETAGGGGALLRQLYSYWIMLYGECSSVGVPERAARDDRCCRSSQQPAPPTPTLPIRAAASRLSTGVRELKRSIQSNNASDLPLPLPILTVLIPFLLRLLSETILCVVKALPCISGRP